MRLNWTWIAIWLLVTSGPAVAQQTPNHVFQKTLMIRTMLDELNASNYSTTTYAAEKPPAAQPRHVFHLGLDVWRQTQLLRFMNGLPTQAAVPVPARMITPSDVHGLVSSLQSQIAEIYPAYGLTLDVKEPQLPSGKTPTDVYENLLRISAGLDSLGIPATVPNDVYLVATALLNNVTEMANAHTANEVPQEVLAIPVVPGQTPKDAYAAALALMADIETLTQTHAKFEIPGGVIKQINTTKGSPSPTDVVLVLIRAQADIDAMRLSAGDSTVGRTATYVGGKTPSDVVQAIKQAQAVIRFMTTEKLS